MKRTLYTLFALSAMVTAQAYANAPATTTDPANLRSVVASDTSHNKQALTTPVTTTATQEAPAAQPVNASITDPLSTASIPEANMPELQASEQNPRNAYGVFFDVNVGTQGVGFDLGYEFNRYIKMRFRASWMDFKYNDTWNDMDLEAQFNNSSTGLLVDVHPFGGKFRVTAGLNFAPMTVKATGSMDAGGGYAGEYSWGGYDYKVGSGRGWVHGEYKWDRVQPYLGIGWSSDGDGDRSLYFHFDLGVNFMGKGNFTVSSGGDVQQRVTGSDKWEPVNNSMLRDAFMDEGKDFFDIADKIVVYPVLQFGMGYRF